MIASMTAFARKSEEAPWGTMTWEMRSVNHRYLDISVKMPDMFRPQERAVRETIAKVLKRGKVDAYLKFVPGEQVPYEMSLNHALVSQYAKAANTLLAELQHATVNVADVLSMPGVLMTTDTQTEHVGQAALHLLTETLQDLAQMRQQEGEGLRVFLSERLEAMLAHVQTVQTRYPLQLDAQRQRVLDRFAELKLELNQERLEQEMVWLAQKQDIAEELQRLQSHVGEVQRLLKRGGVLGRRLDFFMQELNRETNTLGSKSGDAAISQAVIDMKVLVEQMREQVQNIE